jgi:hypothetical protein
MIIALHWRSIILSMNRFCVRRNLIFPQPLSIGWLRNYFYLCSLGVKPHCRQAKGTAQPCHPAKFSSTYLEKNSSLSREFVRGPGAALLT